MLRIPSIKTDVRKISYPFGDRLPLCIWDKLELMQVLSALTKELAEGEEQQAHLMEG